MVFAVYAWVSEDLYILLCNYLTRDFEREIIICEVEYWEALFDRAYKMIHGNAEVTFQIKPADTIEMSYWEGINYSSRLMKSGSCKIIFWA